MVTAAAGIGGGPLDGDDGLVALSLVTAELRAVAPDLVASLASANPSTRAASREAGESGNLAFLLVVNDGLNSRLDGLQVGLLEANQANDALEETEGESNSLVTRDAAITIEIDGAKAGLALRLSGDGSVGAIIVGLELGGLRGPGSYETAALSNTTGRP